jgi:hypothetical protein
MNVNQMHSTLCVFAICAKISHLKQNLRWPLVFQSIVISIVQIIIR